MDEKHNGGLNTTPIPWLLSTPQQCSAVLSTPWRAFLLGIIFIICSSYQPVLSNVSHVFRIFLTLGINDPYFEAVNFARCHSHLSKKSSCFRGNFESEKRKAQGEETSSIQGRICKSKLSVNLCRGSDRTGTERVASARGIAVSKFCCRMVSASPA